MTSQNRETPSGFATSTQRLASVLLEQDIRDWLAERRTGDNKVPWRFIARELQKATNGQVDVTHETLRQWHGEERAA